MANQLHVAHSATITGSGIIAGRKLNSPKNKFKNQKLNLIN